MKIILTKTTKVTLKGEKVKKLTPVNGKEIEVTDANGKTLIENGLAIDPLKKVVAPSKNDAEIETLKSDVETLKADVETKDESLTTANAEIETLKSEIETLKADVDLLNGGGDK